MTNKVREIQIDETTILTTNTDFESLKSAHIGLEQHNAIVELVKAQTKVQGAGGRQLIVLDHADSYEGVVKVMGSPDDITLMLVRLFVDIAKVMEIGRAHNLFMNAIISGVKAAINF